MSENRDYYNRGGLIALIGSITFVTLFFLYLAVVQKGVDLDEKVTEPAAPGAVKFDLASVKNPWEESPDILTAGQKLFTQNCAACHGAKGDLVGGIPNARDLVKGEWKAGAGKIAHFKVLQNGLPGTTMVSFKAQLKPYERWAIVHFIESITKNKGSDKAEDLASFGQSAD